MTRPDRSHTRKRADRVRESERERERERHDQVAVAEDKESVEEAWQVSH